MDDYHTRVDALCKIARNYYDYTRYRLEFRQYKSHWNAVEHAVSPDPTACIVPIGNDVSADHCASLIRKTMLYSDTLLCVIDGMVDAWVGDQYDGLVTIDGFSIFREVLDLSAKYADLVRAGKIAFIPETVVYFHDEIGEVHDNVYSAPLIQSTHVPYLPLTRRTPVTSPYDQFVVKSIILPYFPNIDLVALGRIAHEESDSFVRFGGYLRRRLADIAAADSVETIANLAEEIDYNVAELKIEADKLKRNRHLANAEVAFFATSIAMAAAAPGPTPTAIAGIAGSATLLDLLRRRGERRDAMADLKKSDFYVPYLLSEPTLSQ